MDIEKFSRVCGMLGSDAEGERASAALQATRMLREGGLTWGEVIKLAAAPSQAPILHHTPWQKCEPKPGRVGVFRGEDVRDLLMRANQKPRLSHWEKTFLASLTLQVHHGLTHKQCLALRKIIYGFHHSDDIP